ncbi:hypothetical protein DPX16_23567 [Anabarilius grahami]|uniref:Uncharacterized protein n=1 Tax=Anabarilius grahami TaxID=495550 RepID=A0A3N0XQD8_ANAGA|nr:hypothetical protein DPX16_23567 [Anabarilius grahami]
MGLFVMSEMSASPISHPPASAVDHLIGLLQDGCSLERYVEEFVELAYVANWPDACLNALFLEGLEESTIGFVEPADYLSLDDTINLILYLNGSKFVVEEVPDSMCNSRPISPETWAAWPVRHSPSSSACPSSELFPCVLPDPQTSAGPGRPKRRKRKTKQPKTPEFPASMQPKIPVFSASVQPKIPVFSASVQPKIPVFSASVQPKSPVFSASVQPKIPVFSAPVPPKSPEISAAKQPNIPVKPASLQPKLPELPAAEPAPAFADPASVPVELLIMYEGMSWTPFPDPSPAAAKPAAPAAAEPAAPCTAEPAAPCTDEPAAPCTDDPTPALSEPAQARKPTHVYGPFKPPPNLPKYFF